MTQYRRGLPTSRREAVGAGPGLDEGDPPQSSMSQLADGHILVSRRSRQTSTYLPVPLRSSSHLHTNAEQQVSLAKLALRLALPFPRFHARRRHKWPGEIQRRGFVEPFIVSSCVIHPSSNRTIIPLLWRPKGPGAADYRRRHRTDKDRVESGTRAISESSSRP